MSLIKDDALKGEQVEVHNSKNTVNKLKISFRDIIANYWDSVLYFIPQEYQSFTDLQFSRDKVLTCIEWHPTIKGVIAVSCAENMTFDERIDNSSKIIMRPSLILIWSFADPIHPQVRFSLRCIWWSFFGLVMDVVEL